MLDPDISSRDALALLSAPDHHRLDGTAEGLDRRAFLQLVGLGLGGGIALNSFDVAFGATASDSPRAHAAGPLGANERILVLIGLYGGNDGLNTVVPFATPRYYDYRRNIAIQPANVLALNGEFGLHPNLTYLKSLYDQGRVAVVHGVGYPNPDLSHFNSMANWMSGRLGVAPTTGWIGRWLDGLGSRADLYTAATIGSSLPLHLVGAERRGTAVPVNGFGFGGDSEAYSRRFYDGIKAYSATSGGRGQWHDAIAVAERSQIDLAQRLSPVFTPAITVSSLAEQLTVAARLINADVGFRVLDTSLGSFDHHSGEPWEHGQRTQQLNDGLRAFFDTLSPSFAGRVTLMTWSEFGRTPWSNDSQGTDHGTAAAHFVIGANVKGGMYGTPPSLSNSNGGPIERWGRINHTIDFRSLYATMIDGLLGGGSSTVLGGNFQTLDLFRAPSADPFPGGTGTPSAPSLFTGMTPARLLDTRDVGVPIGPGETISVPVAGQRGVPVGAVAAVLNVTGVDSTASSYLTVWPSDVAKPGTSSLNTAGHDVVPNLVLTKIGASGSVSIYNFVGHTHCVVDVVGYFARGSGGGFVPLSPERVLDTRVGLGAPAGPVAGGASIDVAVGGVAGVAPDADSVVVNVTVTEPTVPGYLTVWPAGAGRPTASNLNFVAGQTVPNLVVAKLGGGSVSLFNSGGSAHVVADVLGYFSAGGGSGSSLVALSPARLLDTRDGTGVPSAAPVQQSPIALTVLGRGGVPDASVTAVVLNVTATAASTNGFVTVYPHGEARPMASNLNTVAGATRANLVIAKVGGDGAVAMFNSSGSVHLVADVVGYFATS